MFDYINKLLDNQFKELIESIDNLSSLDFKNLYIIYFLEFITKEEYINNKDRIINSMLKDMVLNTSLCEQEYDYLCKIADLSSDTDLKTFIKNALEIYENTSDLERCQLGESMKNRLNFFIN